MVGAVDMRRRDVLRYLGSVGVVGLAGCAAPIASSSPQLTDIECPTEIDHCYHDGVEGPVYLEPKRKRVALGTEADFSLVNRTNGALFIGPDDCSLWRRTADSWSEIRPDDNVYQIGAEVTPFSSYTWSFSVRAAVPDDLSPSERGWGGLNRVAFDPGRYCFEVRNVELGEEGERKSFGAMFDVVEA